MSRATDKPIVHQDQDILGPLLLFGQVRTQANWPQPERIIGDEVELYRRQFLGGDHAPPKALMFARIGAAALSIIYKLEVDWEPREFCKLLLEKHKRYGAHPLRVWGPMGVVIRIHSKYERFENIREDPSGMLLDEGTLDTVHDILGYSVLGYLTSEAT